MPQPHTVIRLALLALVCSLGTCGETRAQEPRSYVRMDDIQQPTNQRQMPFLRMPGLYPDYVVGPGDVLEVTVLQGSRDPMSVKISSQGQISIPLIGSVAVAGLTVEQVESVVAAAYRDRDLITNPQVLVFVSSYESKNFYAVGELDRAGEYSFSFQTTLMDLILMAGGLDFTAADYGFLHRRATTASPEWRPTYVEADEATLANAPDQAAPGTEVVRIDLRPLKEGGVLEQNIQLRNGDVFYVPRRAVRTLYVVGDVVRPGAFEMPQERSMTAAQAISWAGGPTKTARMSDGVLVRQNPEGGRSELPVDFAAVLRGDEQDFEVLPDDVIFVPTSNAKVVGYGFLQVIPRFLLLRWLF